MSSQQLCCYQKLKTEESCRGKPSHKICTRQRVSRSCVLIVVLCFARLFEGLSTPVQGKLQTRYLQWVAFLKRWKKTTTVIDFFFLFFSFFVITHFKAKREREREGEDKKINTKHFAKRKKLFPPSFSYFYLF